jgi:hypothetical protein
MKFLLNTEAAIWCKATPRLLTVRENITLSYGEQVTHSVKYEVPSTYEAIVRLLNRLLTASKEGDVEGGLVWQLNWWSEKESERVALNVIDKVRHGYGEIRSLEDAPAYLFESAELYDAITFLVQPLLNTWSTVFVSASGQYFILATVSGYLYYIARDKLIVERVLENTAGWKPQQELPGYLRQDKSA